MRAVAEHDRQRRGHINSQINFFLARVRTDDSIDIAENILNIHRQRLRFAALKQRTQLPNRRDCPRVVAHDVVERLTNLAEVGLLCREQAPRRARVVEHSAQRLIQLMRQRCGQLAHHRDAGDVTHFRCQPANFRSRALTLQRTAEHLGYQAQSLNNPLRPVSLAKNRAERDAADDDTANFERDLNDGLESDAAAPFEILRGLRRQIRLTRQDRQFARKNFRVQPWQDLADVEPHRIHAHAFAGPLMGDQNLAIGRVHLCDHRAVDFQEETNPLQPLRQFLIDLLRAYSYEGRRKFRKQVLELERLTCVSGRIDDLPSRT